MQSRSTVMRAAAVVLLLVLLLLLLTPEAPGPRAFDILQAPLERLLPELLDERQPIVIEQALADPTQLLEATFRYRYAVAREAAATAGELVEVQARYCLVWALRPGGCLLHLRHPAQRPDGRRLPPGWEDLGEPYVSVRLGHRRACIVPHGWLLAVDAPEARLVHVEDVRSLVSRAWRSLLVGR